MGVNMLMTAATSSIVAPTLARVSGGTFWMGAQKSDESKPNFDKNALDREGPVCRVTVPDFDIATWPTTVSEFKGYADEFAERRFGVFGRRRITEQVGDSSRPRVREELHLVMRGDTQDTSSMKPVQLGDPELNWGDFNGGFTAPAEIVPEKGWLRDCGDAFLAGDAPVTGVSWYMAQAFVEWLRIGLEDPRYTLLPEAWLERAMRGPQGSFAYGTQTGEINQNLAVYAQKTITAVATKPGVLWNGTEVHDLAGLVWEWSRDWYAAYPSGDKNDPHGPETGSTKVLRGGSWRVNAKYARSADRYFDVPDIRNYVIGFRVGRSVSPQSNISEESNMNRYV